jgi:hypothetical protein
MMIVVVVMRVGVAQKMRKKKERAYQIKSWVMTRRRLWRLKT